MVYADSSVIVSLALGDAMSELAMRLLVTGKKPLVWNSLLSLEVGNAIQFAVGLGGLGDADASRASLRVEDLERQHRLVMHEPEWPRVFLRAKGLSQTHTAKTGSRSLDILHVACAMEVGTRCFWSFDKKQRALAEGAGLSVNVMD